MVPWSSLYGRNFSGLREGTRALALTYDDGPNDPWTLRLLDVLARHNARATFFMLGEFVRQEMENAVQFNVPLTVDLAFGPDWASAH